VPGGLFEYRASHLLSKFWRASVPTTHCRPSVLRYTPLCPGAHPVKLVLRGRC